MTKDEALKMAIEALLYGTDHTNAVKACKEALEQPFTRDWKETIDERIARDGEFKEALKQPLQDYVLTCKKCGDDLVIEYAPDEQQEPYAYAYIRGDGVGQLCWTKRDASLFKDLLEGWKEILLYTHPHQWQGLTDDEIQELTHDGVADEYDIKFARAVLAKAKEKNHG